MEIFIQVLPLVLMIILVITTRKLVLSFLVGILLSAFIINFDTNVYMINEVGIYLFGKIANILTDFGWSIPIFLFLFVIGIMASLMTLSGINDSFADYATGTANSKVKSQMLVFVAGIIIFIDGCFNSLTVGEFTKQITDKFNVSRAKLAYIIDSTSAPIVSIVPISSWGAFISVILDQKFTEVGYNEITGLGAVVMMIPYQFYEIASILLVLVVILFGINIGDMKKAENQSLTFDESRDEVSKGILDIDVSKEPMSLIHMFIPIALILFVPIFILWYQIDFRFDALDLVNQGLAKPLLYGSLLALIYVLIVSLLHKVRLESIFKVSMNAISNTLRGPALILLLAWTLSSIIGDLEIGAYIVDVIPKQGNILVLVPVIIFILAGLMSFVTGTSWGTFGILLPIVASFAVNIDLDFLLVSLAAVISGSVFGDHCSPISDTTILSATGAGCSLDSHFRTQLPYALISGFISITCFLILGVTNQIIIALMVLLTALVVVIFTYKKLKISN